MSRPVNIDIALNDLRNTAVILDRDDHPCTAQLMRASIEMIDKEITKVSEACEELCKVLLAFRIIADGMVVNHEEKSVYYLEYLSKYKFETVTKAAEYVLGRKPEEDKDAN